MTKEEKIKEAYGEHWFEMEDYMQEIVLQNNGWISTMFMPGYNAFSGEHVNIEIEKDNGIVRPKSLQGIENNNGWIKIESEDDLPKESGYYFTKSDVWWEPYYRIDIFCGKLSNSFENGKSCFTHYQPIEKPKPPLY